jgi:hypothetical protein
MIETMSDAPRLWHSNRGLARDKADDNARYRARQRLQLTLPA